MAVAGKTSEAVLVVGGNSWAQDLSDYANGVDVPGTLNTERLTVLESDGVETVALSSSLQIAIGTMYYGAGPKVVAAHQADTADSYVALLVPNVGCYFGAAIWDSLPFDNPTGGVVSHAATFRAGDAWSWGEGVAVAKPFVLNATTSSVNIGSVPANAKLLLIVTDATSGLPSTTVAFVTRNQALTAPGIWTKNAPSSVTTSATVSATLTGNREISGYVLVGQNFEVD